MTEDQSISIHALLAESDLIVMLYDTSSLTFLSTLSLRRATVNTADQEARKRLISIHALLAESDDSAPLANGGALYFYPRSPCGERLHYDNYNLHCVEISIHALLAESDSVCSS